MSEFATLPCCPDCGCRMSVDETVHARGNTYRKLRCICGERFETEEAITRRLPPVAVRTRPSVPVGTGGHPPIPVVTGPPSSGGGVGGGVSEGSTQHESSDSNPQASLLSEPRARARRNRDAEYTQEFERLWIGCDRQGHKEAAARAYEERGKPDVDKVIAAWKAYRASLPSWRSPKDVSAWLRIKGHIQQYEPAPPEPNRQVVPFAVAAEKERSARVISERAKLAFGGGK